MLKQFDDRTLPADLKCVAETADFNFFYRRQEYERDAMLSGMCEKLEASQIEGEWPLNREVRDEELIARGVSEACEMLDFELV